MGYYTERAINLARAKIEKSGEPLTLAEAVGKTFEENPTWYTEYRKEELAAKPEEPVAHPATVEKTVGQLAAEGIAKQLVAKSAATDMADGIARAFRLRPDLYELHRHESFAHLG